MFAVGAVRACDVTLRAGSGEIEGDDEMWSFDFDRDFLCLRG
jgi:hypothetical protein